MEVDDSVSSTLQKLLIKKVFAVLKPAILDKMENGDERVHTIIENAIEVCYFA